MPKQLCFHGLGQMTQAIDARIHPSVQRFYRSSRDDPLKPLSSTSGPCIHIAGVNSSGIDWLIASLSKFQPSECWLLTKGLRIEDKLVKTFPEFLMSALPKWKFGMIAGPALAADVKNTQIPLSLLLASNDHHLDLTSYFDLTALRIYHSSDLQGVCYLAALKNIYAMILGFAAEYSLSSLAMFYTQANLELEMWLTLVNGKNESVRTVAGMGDLLVTAIGGRNARFGQAMASGLCPSQIMQGPMVGITVEGYALFMKLKTCELFEIWLQHCPNSMLRHLNEALSFDVPLDMRKLLS